MKKVLVVLIVVVLLGGAVALYAVNMASDPPANFRIETVERGNLMPTIPATGTVEPEEVVDVGAQVQGRVKTLGQDKKKKRIDPKTKKETSEFAMIDYGSEVEDGTILANIDDAVYRAQRDQTLALLNRAKADLKQCEAKRD
jgi:HlyD family secretion protein